jgi:hypothetical protein
VWSPHLVTSHGQKAPRATPTRRHHRQPSTPSQRASALVLFGRALRPTLLFQDGPHEAYCGLDTARGVPRSGEFVHGEALARTSGLQHDGQMSKALEGGFHGTASVHHKCTKCCTGNERLRVGERLRAEGLPTLLLLGWPFEIVVDTDGSQTFENGAVFERNTAAMTPIECVDPRCVAFVFDDVLATRTVPGHRRDSLHT